MTGLEASTWILGARNEIGQALLNLLANALDALEGAQETRRGGRVSVSLAAEDEEGRPGFALVVSDDGPGVDAAELEHEVAALQPLASKPLVVCAWLTRFWSQALAAELDVTPIAHAAQLAPMVMGTCMRARGAVGTVDAAAAPTVPAATVVAGCSLLLVDMDQVEPRERRLPH